jgi:hypothetical protein
VKYFKGSPTGVISHIRNVLSCAFKSWPPHNKLKRFRDHCAFDKLATNFLATVLNPLETHL